MSTDDVPFSIDAFIDKLASYVNRESGNGTLPNARGWEYVGSKALAKSRRVPVPSMMYVTLTY
jgi:hypothetical protein